LTDAGNSKLSICTANIVYFTSGGSSSHIAAAAAAAAAVVVTLIAVQPLLSNTNTAISCPHHRFHFYQSNRQEKINLAT